jgi:hypothetical protein
MKSIIYVQHCLIPPVTLQTIPRASLSHGQHRHALQPRIVDVSISVISWQSRLK